MSDPKVCASCSKVIPNHWVIYDEKFFHRECFRCGPCNRIIDPKETFMSQEGKLVCHGCQTQHYQARCAVCDEVTIGTRLIYQDKNFHYTCKNCKSCGKPFEAEQHDHIVIRTDGSFVHDNCSNF